VIFSGVIALLCQHELFFVPRMSYYCRACPSSIPRNSLLFSYPKMLLGKKEKSLLHFHKSRLWCLDIVIASYFRRLENDITHHRSHIDCSILSKDTSRRSTTALPIQDHIHFWHRSWMYSFRSHRKSVLLISQNVLLECSWMRMVPRPQ
jgi:hypothetical protein